jgi:hypothetical protein
MDETDMHDYIIKNKIENVKLFIFVKTVLPDARHYYLHHAWFLVSLSAAVMALTVRASLVASLLGERNELSDPL